MICVLSIVLKYNNSSLNTLRRYKRLWRKKRGKEIKGREGRG